MNEASFMRWETWRWLDAKLQGEMRAKHYLFCDATCLLDAKGKNYRKHHAALFAGRQREFDKILQMRVELWLAFKKAASALAQASMKDTPPPIDNF